MQTIRLNGYTVAASVPLLRLGTRDSFGIERLQVVPGAEWEGLALTATFVTPAGSTRMVVGGGRYGGGARRRHRRGPHPRNTGAHRLCGHGGGGAAHHRRPALPGHRPRRRGRGHPRAGTLGVGTVRHPDAAGPGCRGASHRNPGQVLTKTSEGNVWTYPSGAAAEAAAGAATPSAPASSWTPKATSSRWTLPTRWKPTTPAPSPRRRCTPRWATSMRCSPPSKEVFH